MYLWPNSKPLTGAKEIKYSDSSSLSHNLTLEGRVEVHSPQPYILRLDQVWFPKGKLG